MPDLLTFLALAAFVLVLAGLTEGFVSRAPLSFPMIFLGLGVVLGYRGVISLSPRSPMLEAVAVVTLSLVLFLDAVRMKFDRSASEWLVPSLVLGPGTILCLLEPPGVPVEADASGGRAGDPISPGGQGSARGCPPCS